MDINKLWIQLCLNRTNENGEKTPVRVRFADPNVFEGAYSDLELVDGEVGPIPDEADLIADFVALQAKVQDADEFKLLISRTSMSSLRGLLYNGVLTQKQMQIVLCDLLERIEKLEK